MALPGGLTDITQNTTITINGFPTSGNLVYKYSPFQNLQVLAPIGTDPGLQELRLSALSAGMNVDTPLVIDTEVAYDGSVNVVFSDKENALKMVNSRFYLTDSSHYAIADRAGNLDTNIYTVANFQTESALIKSVKSVITLDFLGVYNGGILPVGNYNFYFKLADFDGNETDFISESGQVVCYIGTVNNPFSIRGGQLNENSEKLIKFKLNNLDMAYDYINVYYSRDSGDQLTNSISVYKITNKFKITGTSTTVTITGYENTQNLSTTDLNLRYANFDQVKSMTPCQNMIFAGNIHTDYSLFTLLENYSLFVYPKITLNENIGNLNGRYIDTYFNGNEYYNPNNIYYKLGYWDEEIYRLGIVYIMNDYSLSPVFNIRGITSINETTTISNFETLPLGKNIDYDENYTILSGSGNKTTQNTKGVFRINTTSSAGIINHTKSITPIGIQLIFDPKVLSMSARSTTELSFPLISDITRGFFIVRQKRIPTILAQGLSISTTNEGHIPVIQDSSGLLLESFLTAVTPGITATPVGSGIVNQPTNTAVPKIGRSTYSLPISNGTINSMLCPEASLRKDIYSSLFNSSAFHIKPHKYQPFRKYFINLENNNVDVPNKLYTTDDITYVTPSSTDEKDTDLLLVDSEINLISNKNNYFSSIAGNATESWKHTDPINGNIEDISLQVATIGVNGMTVNQTILYNDNQLSKDTRKTRGIFNSYIGTTTTLNPMSYYNIFNTNYATDDATMLEYFGIRFNDSSSFSPISDRMTWAKLANNGSIINCYRGDCYINTYTHRMMWNFIDPDLPTNNRVVDPFTWYKNYKVRTTYVKANKDFVIEDNIDSTDSNALYNITNSYNEVFTYKKVLPTFTYKLGSLDPNGIDIGQNLANANLIVPESRAFKKYSQSNGTFGTSMINRADINSVGLGHWVTFKICSNINLALRDEDSSNPVEETLHKRKRSFYPYASADVTNNLPDSNIINRGISRSLGSRYYFEIPDVPFIKTYFTNRIYHSNLLVDSVFKDGSRIFELQNYQDYTMEHGQITKLVNWYGTLIAIMEHGVLMIPVNERAMMQNASGENVYINTDTVLPKNPKVLSNIYGSLWDEGIINTPRFIYGIDTVGKKIWRTNGEQFEIISDMKIQKFLNDNILLKVTDQEETIIQYMIKAHYNAFKQDVIFVFKYGLISWVLCWNEISNIWTTRYTWFPEFSENINNIFYTFANKLEHPGQEGKLFKHGWAGTLEEQGYIKPTVWYETQYPFEFEFVVSAEQGVQKIFNNLKIISNKAQPEYFTFEIVGEGYDWYKYKNVISWIENIAPYNEGLTTEQLDFLWNENGYYSIQETNAPTFYDAYTFLLTHTMAQIEAIYPDFPRPDNMLDTDMFMKIPYIPKVKFPTPLDVVNWKTLHYDTALINDEWGGEDRVLMFQYGKSITNPLFGRLRGNMQYCEDSWDIQIQPLKFRYAYMKTISGTPTLVFTDYVGMKVRDKYMKIRVSYDGKKLVLVNALKTSFINSYA